MIKSVKFCKYHARRIKNLKISRKGISLDSRYNVLIGPNMYGKSTILEAMVHCPDCLLDKTPDTRVLYRTSEQLNPGFNTKGYLGLEEMLFSMRALFSSCGEIGQDVMKHSMYSGENCFLVDSPEIGQDGRNVKALHKGFLRLVDKGKQVVIVTHNISLLGGSNIIELKKGYLKELILFTEASLRKLNPSFPNS